MDLKSFGLDKINNSYESEPSSNSGSEGGIGNVEPEIHCIDNLKEFLISSMPASRENGQQENKRQWHSSPVCSKAMVPIDISENACQAMDLPLFDNHCSIQLKPLPATEESKSVQEDENDQENARNLSAQSSIRTCSSEEISDQDIRFKLDLSKFGGHLRDVVSSNHGSTSQSSIEPSSSPSEDEIERKKKRKCFSSECHLSAFCENSCNAVDVPVTKGDSEQVEGGADLSFNGKINIAESTERADTANERDRIARLNLELLQNERSREMANERSPDLFSDDEYEEDEKADEIAESVALDSSLKLAEGSDENGNAIEDKDKRLMKHMQDLLSGVLPPPSVTIVDHDIATILSMYKTNSYLLKEQQQRQKDEVIETAPKTFLSPTEVKAINWPTVLQTNTHGLHYNRNQYTESIEMLYMKLAERHVGAETGSSYTYTWPASVKKSKRKSMMAKSPGNRLSHLARRRAIFSSANLLSNLKLVNQSKLGSKQCVIDTTKLMRKEKVRTPKRRTPGRRKTPGRSSSKKAHLTHILPKPITATRETSKRALFQSPTQEKPKPPQPSVPINVRIDRTRRALFSPPKAMDASTSSMNRTHSDLALSMKRRREMDQDDENNVPRPSKLARSQSICVNSVQSAQNSLLDFSSRNLNKASSETILHPSQQLSNSHKQKLLWAVSTALKKKSITTTHANFKEFASTLAKVVKRIYLESESQKADSTSVTMLRLAEKFVFWVIQGKSVDELYLAEKARAEQEKQQQFGKLSGYIAPEEFENRRKSQLRGSSNILSQSLSMESFSFTQSSSQIRTQSSENLSQSSCSFSQQPSDNKMMAFDEIIEKTCVASSTSNELNNSSSKNNLSGNVLRENVDSKSAQKNYLSFSGKDQKNVSPYSDKVRASSNKPQRIFGSNSVHSNLMKVKRQISFDG